MKVKKAVLFLLVIVVLIAVIAFSFQNIFNQSDNLNVELINKQTSNLIGWGNNSYGQLGDLASNNPVPDLTDLQVNDIKQIAAKGTSTMILTNDGKVISIGDPLAQKKGEDGYVKLDYGKVLDNVIQIS